MKNEKASFNDEQGWKIDATLHRYKKFMFADEQQTTIFMKKLLKIESPKEVRVEIMPNTLNKFIEVLMIYQPNSESEVKIIMENIEECFQKTLL